jgi:RNA polymerase sigma-70 factor (ECF subfamily)
MSSTVIKRMMRTGADTGALEALYRARFDEYCSVAAAILRDRDAGRDAVQEAFANAVRARSSFRGTGSLDAWVWRAVVNAAMSERRRQPPDPVYVPGADPSTNGHSEDDDVRTAIALLPERQRLVLFLRYYADLDYQTIAEALGIASGTVAAALHAAHAALRRHLEEVPA